MTRAILFDLDDTLLVDDAARDAALVATVATAGDRDGRDPAALAATVRERAAAIWRDGPVFPYCHAIGITSGEGLWGHFAGDDPNLSALRAWTPAYRQQVWSQALQEHGVDDPPLAANLAARFPYERRARLALFPETVAVLRELRHRYRLAIITNGAPDLQREKIETTGLAATFDAITISGDLGIGKPQAEIFALTLDRVGIAAVDAVMVGNDLGRDVAGAHNAGLRAVWIERGASEGGPAATPDATIASLSELPALLCAVDGAP